MGVEPELLGLHGVGSSELVVSDSLQRQGSSRLWMGVAAVVLAVAAGAWAVGRVGSAGPEGSAGTQSSAPATEPDAAATDPSIGGDDTAANGQPGTTDGIRITEETTTTADGASGEPVLGRPVGWALLLGSPFGGSDSLERIDLDTGIETSFDGAAHGAPVLIGGRLVLVTGADTGSPKLRIVPLADPTTGGPEVAMGDAVSPLPYSWPFHPGPDGDTFWLYVAKDGEAVWRLIRSSDGELVEEMAAGKPYDAPPVPGAGPDVVTSGGGGVYGRDGDGGYRFITGGRPLAVSDGSVLVQSCTGPAACQKRWVSVASGAPVDRPIPPDDGTFWFYVVPGSDRYLYGRRQTSGFDAVAVIFDLDTGRVIESQHSISGGVATTPDSRIIVLHTDTGIELFDTDQDRWFVVARGFGGSLSFAFVSNGG